MYLYFIFFYFYFFYKKNYVFKFFYNIWWKKFFYILSIILFLLKKKKSKNSHFNLNFCINIENILYIHKNLEFLKILWKCPFSDFRPLAIDNIINNLLNKKCRLYIEIRFFQLILIILFFRFNTYFFQIKNVRISLKVYLIKFLRILKFIEFWNL
jgi:hypothetical protein